MANIYVDYFDVVLIDMTLDGMRAITIAAQNVSPEIFVQKSFCYICLRISFERARTLDIFLCLAAEGMWDLRSSKPQLTCLTRFLSLAFLLATLAGWGGGMAYPRVGWW